MIKLSNDNKGKYYTNLNFGSTNLSRATFNALDNAWNIKANILGYDSFKMNVNENVNLQGSAFVYDLTNKAHFALLKAKIMLILPCCILKMILHRIKMPL